MMARIIRMARNKCKEYNRKKATQYERPNNEITKSEANHLMLFINNCGPSFAISTVGGMMFGNVKIGGIIYLSHILSSMTIGIILSFFPPLIKKTSILKHT